MREAQGYLTQDNRFFASREEAELHEATEYLKASLIAFAGPRADFGRFMFVITNLKNEIGSYLNAAQALEEYENRKSEDNDAAEHVGHGQEESDPNPPDLGIGTNDEANEQLSAGGPDAVSNLGSRALAQEIRDLGTSNGAGSRRGDAQGVLSGADLATVAPAETGEARHDDRRASLWEDVDAYLQSGRGRVQGPSGPSPRAVLRNIAQHGLAGQPNGRDEDDE